MDKILEIIINLIIPSVHEFYKVRDETHLYLINKRRRITNPGSDNVQERDEIKNKLSDFESRFALCQNRFLFKKFQHFKCSAILKIPNDGEMKELAANLRFLRNNIYEQKPGAPGESSETFNRIMLILRMKPV